MALVLKDRVKETTTTTGTGAITLAGAVSNFQTFTSVLSNADTTYYAIIDDTNNEFEVGLGTFASSGTTLTRTTILESSNSGSAVNLGTGTKQVFMTYPAEKSVFLDGSGNVELTGALGVNGGSTNGIQISQGAIKIKNGGVQSYIDFYCESNNAHYARLQAPAHANFSGNPTITLPNSTSTIATTSLTETFTNKTLTTPTISSPTISGTAQIGGSNGVDISQGAISIKNGGVQSYVRFYCESSNAHYAQLQAPAHSAFSGNVTITLPATTDTLVGKTTTDTLTNKTLTSPAITGTATFGGTDGVSISQGAISIKNGGTQSYVDFYCESSNAHRARLQAPAHSDFSGNITLTLPATTGTIALTSDITSQDLDATTDSGTIDVALGSETLTVSGGSGISTSATGTTITVAGDDASTSSKGVASFASADFSVSSGAVSIKSGGVSNTQLAGSIADSKLSTISTADKVDIGALDIDGATDIGADLEDADLIIVDDGANGTERKSAISRVPTYVFSKVSGDATIASNGALTIASGSVENSMLAGSIANSKLANSSITVSDGSNTTATALGGTITFSGTSNEVDVAESSGTITIGLPDDVTIGQNLTVTGNLTVSGTTTQTGAVTTNDNFNILSNNNSANNTDFGLAGKYVESSTTKYAGIFYDASTDNTFRLFCDTQTEPSTTVNISATGYAAANLIIGALTASSLDISGDVDVDGSLETDAISINGTTVSATAAELNKLSGVNTTTAELNHVNGVTSAIQTQLNAKAPLASPELTGNPTAPTQSSSDNSTKIATTAFVTTKVGTSASLDDVTALAIALG